jgi:hypothetical protein
MRALFVTLVLAATAAPAAQDQQSAPKPASVDGTTYRTVDKECDCGTAYRTRRDWNLHRPSTPKEQAETSRLNREYLEASRGAARASAPPAAPDPAQLAYQQQLKNYRALTASYERRMRDYRRLHAQADVAERNWQDAARLDPYRGYNSRPGNGY